MTSPPALLPDAFRDLEPFVAAWSVFGSDARTARRLASTETQRLAFYTAMKDRLAAALDHLDRKPLATLDARDQNLLNLTLTLAHIAQAVENYGGQEAEHAISHRHFRIVASPAGVANKPA